MDFKDNVNKWLKGYRTVLRCNYCGDEIYSKSSGEWVECACGKYYIDQTPYYCRVGGDTTEGACELLDDYFEELDQTKETKREKCNCGYDADSCCGIGPYKGNCDEK